MSENNGFKNTEIGIIPADWEINEIQNISQKIWIGLVTTMTSHYVENGIPLIRNNNIKPNKIFSLNMIFLDADFSERNKHRYLHTGDIVTVHTGDIGTSTIIEPEFDPSHGFATINTSVDETIIYNKYLCYYFNSPIFKHRIEAYATGDGRSNFNLYDYLFVKVPYPQKIHEQRKIARILSTVDAVIEKTEASIDKYKNIKAGMMRDLFTRGIDLATGKLRTSYEEAPALYKHSELGWVPKEWETKKFNDIVKDYFDFRGRTPLKLGMNWGNGEYKAISANNVEMGRLNFDKEFYTGGDELYNAWMTKGDCAKGDVLMTSEAPLGIIAQISDDSQYILSQRVILFKTNSQVVLNDYLFFLMMDNQFQTKLLKNSSGSTVTGIQQARLALIKISIPKELLEQERIALKLKSISTIIEAEDQNLKKVKKLKYGLMSDLLTGKVRVKYEKEK